MAGLVFYTVYRRRFVREPLTETVKAPPAYGPALALEYRRLLVPVLSGRASDDALDIAAGLAAERGAQITAVYVVEIPLDLPLSADLPAEEALANRELDEARAIGESYGVTVIPRLVRARNAGAAIVREAERRDRDRRHRRAAEGPAEPQAGDLRAHRRLRAQERALPRARDGREGRRVSFYRGAVAVLAVMFVGIGVALLAVTAANGGGVLGFLLGGLFIALGVGRLTLLRKGGR